MLLFFLTISFCSTVFYSSQRLTVFYGSQRLQCSTVVKGLQCSTVVKENRFTQLTQNLCLRRKLSFAEGPPDKKGTLLEKTDLEILQFKRP